MNTNEFLTVAEMAARLRLCTKTVYELCKSGDLECYRAGRAIRIPSDAIPKPHFQTKKPSVGFQHF